MARDLYPTLDSYGLAALNYALTPPEDRLKIRDVIINGNHKTEHGKLANMVLSKANIVMAEKLSYLNGLDEIIETKNRIDAKAIDN